MSSLPISWVTYSVPVLHSHLNPVPKTDMNLFSHRTVIPWSLWMFHCYQWQTYCLYMLDFNDGIWCWWVFHTLPFRRPDADGGTLYFQPHCSWFLFLASQHVGVHHQQELNASHASSPQIGEVKNQSLLKLYIEMVSSIMQREIFVNSNTTF